MRGYLTAGAALLATACASAPPYVPPTCPAPKQHTQHDRAGESGVRPIDGVPVFYVVENGRAHPLGIAHAYGPDSVTVCEPLTETERAAIEGLEKSLRTDPPAPGLIGRILSGS